MRDKKISKIKEIFIGINNWLQSKLLILMVSGPLILFYSIMHEYSHYISNYFLGYSGKITWGLLKHTLTLYDLNRMSVSHYFLITLAPYIFSLILLSILFSLNVMLPKHKSLFAKIAFFPFLDTLWNYIMIFPAYIFALPADFLNLIRVGFMKNKGIGILSISLGIMILILTIYLFKPFYKTILNIIKIDKNANE